MSIMELGALGEFVGAIAVVVTLIFLTVQIRQNTGIQKLASTQQVLSTSATVGAQNTSDERLMELLVAIAEGNDLTPIQLATFSTWMFSVFAAHWQVQYQYSNGYLDKEIFDTYERRTVYIMKSQPARDWWRANGFRFSATYQGYVDGLVPNDM